MLHILYVINILFCRKYLHSNSKETHEKGTMAIITFPFRLVTLQIFNWERQNKETDYVSDIIYSCPVKSLRLLLYRDKSSVVLY
jgi:hypothetical protein